MCGPNVDFIKLLCAWKICSGVQRQSPWSGGQGDDDPPEAETLLTFGRATETASLLAC